MSLVHFDTRKLSRVGSAVILVSLVGLPVVLGLLIAVLAIGFGLQSGQDWRVMGTVSGVAACWIVGQSFFTVCFAVLIRWVFNGRAPEFLSEVGDELGSTYVPSPRWSFMEKPGLYGELGGHDYRVQLLRYGGVLAPARVGERRLIFRWILQISMASGTGFKANYSPPATPFGGLLGLVPGEEVDGVDVGARGTDEQYALARSAEALESVKAAFEALVQPVAIFAGPDRISLSAHVPDGMEPAQASEAVRQLASLGRILRGEALAGA